MTTINTDRTFTHRGHDFSLISVTTDDETGAVITAEIGLPEDCECDSNEQYPMAAIYAAIAEITGRRVDAADGQRTGDTETWLLTDLGAA